MRVMSLNIWGGCLREALLAFIASHRDVDLFCLQEVYHRASEKISTDDNPVSLDIFSELQAMLPAHRGYFRPVVDGCYGLCLFAGSGLEVIDEGEILIYENVDYVGRGPAHSRILQWMKVGGEQPFAVLNVHGLWNGRGKADSPARLAQSKRIRAFVDELHVPAILCGDFNLRLETESLRLLERRLDNLIRRFKVSSTRTSLYAKAERMADYFFVSPGVRVDAFHVLETEVSDHAPLVLDCVISE